MRKILLPFVLVLFAFYNVPVVAYADSGSAFHSGSSGSGTLQTMLATSSGSSETLVYYPFTSDLSYTILSSSISSATIDHSSLRGFSVGDDGFGSVSEAYPVLGATSYATAVSNNSYFTLTLTATGTVNMDTLVFEVGKGGYADPRGYFVRSSVDGYASDLISETLPSGFAAAPVRKAIALGSAYDGFSSVTFRFYVFTPDDGSCSVDFSDLYVKGSSGVSAVPVSTWSIVAAMLLIALFTLYRVQKKSKPAMEA